MSEPIDQVQADTELTAEQVEALAQLAAAEDRLRTLGFCVVRSAALYGTNPDNFYASTRLNIKFEPGDVMFDHTVMDAIRDISVDWTNARHPDGDKLQWVDKE